MNSRVRCLAVVSLIGVASLGVAGQAGARGGSPFDATAEVRCDGTIAWAVTVGAEPLQALWVMVDYATIAMPQATDEGTYTGETGGFDPLVAHRVTFRRLEEAQVEERVDRDLEANATCMPAAEVVPAELP